MRRAPLALLLVLALVPALSGCGEKKETLGSGKGRPLTLLLDYFPNADHAGIYAAQAGGDFRQAGIDLTIRQPTDPAAPIKQVAAGRVDLAVSYEPEVLRARDRGLDVVAVAALVREPLTSIISLPRAKIRSPRDLRGKTVGTAGIDYQAAYLRTILRSAGVSPAAVKLRNVGFGLNAALLAKRVDATLGGFWNYEGIELRLKRRRPRIIRVAAAGVPSYDELVLVAKRGTLARNGDRIRAFIAALGRGTRRLRADPAKGVGPLLAANRDLDPALQRASVRATLPYFLPAAGKPFGWQDPARWRAFAGWMVANELLGAGSSARGAFTNAYLPGTL